MAKKGSRLREFEKNNRVLDISTAQRSRQEKRNKSREKKKGRKTGQAIKNASSHTMEGAKKKKANWVKPVCIVISLLILAVIGMSVKNIIDLKSKEAALQERKAELTALKEELTVKLNHVNSDEYIEEEARRSLKLVKGNELIFFFPEDMQSVEKEESGSEDDTANP